tara:strand:+ start:112 stop:636 length:525 start_codon:yes stop_codon:yes gene_type:complete
MGAEAQAEGHVISHLVIKYAVLLTAILVSFGSSAESPGSEDRAVSVPADSQDCVTASIYENGHVSVVSDEFDSVASESLYLDIYSDRFGKTACGEEKMNLIISLRKGNLYLTTFTSCLVPEQKMNICFSVEKLSENNNTCKTQHGFLVNRQNNLMGTSETIYSENIIVCGKKTN